MTESTWIDPRTGPLPPPLEDVPILFRDPTEDDIAFDLGYLDRHGRWHLSGTPRMLSSFQPLAWLQIPPHPEWLQAAPVGCGERSEPHHPSCPNCNDARTHSNGSVRSPMDALGGTR